MTKKQKYCYICGADYKESPMRIVEVKLDKWNYKCCICEKCFMGKEYELDDQKKGGE